MAVVLKENVKRKQDFLDLNGYQGKNPKFTGAPVSVNHRDFL